MEKKFRGKHCNAARVLTLGNLINLGQNFKKIVIDSDFNPIFDPNLSSDFTLLQQNHESNFNCKVRIQLKTFQSGLFNQK